jgi:hypothetical protein
MKLTPIGGLLGTVFFYLKDEGSRFFQNIGTSLPNYMASHHSYHHFNILDAL